MKAVHVSSHALRRWLSRAAVWAVCLTALAGTARSQDRQAESQDADKLIERVRQGTFTPSTVNQLARLRAVQAVPALKQQFAAHTDTVTKQALANALVRLGDSEQTYWDFLAEYARAAVESDAPFPIAFDAEGKLVPRQLTPEFLAWAKEHNVSPEGASKAQVYALPVDLTFLAATGDPRGLDLLRQGLTSRNYLIQAVAAKGLARLRDTSSVPVIIAACRKAPAQAAELIARALVFFDDARAQEAAESFIKNQEILDELRRLSREKGPAGVF